MDAIAKNSMSWMTLPSSIQFFTTAAFMLHQRRQYQPLSYKSHFLSHFFVWISLQVFKICSNRPQNVSKMSLKGLLISNRPFLSFLGSTKGQLISKCLFGIFNSKRNKNIWFYYYGNSSQIVFVCFSGKLKKPKRHFEINWPWKTVFICFSIDNSIANIRFYALS